MEVAYSVGVSNRFASLMTEEDDPGDQVISPASAPEKVDKEKKDVKGGGKPKNKESREKGQQTRKSAQDSTKRKYCPLQDYDDIDSTLFQYVYMWCNVNSLIDIFAP